MVTFSKASVYPEESIKEALDAFWEKEMRLSLEDADSTFSLGPEMDSLTAVNCLNEIANILGYQDRLPEVLVRMGGYKSKEDFVESLNSSVKRFYETHA